MTDAPEYGAVDSKEFLYPTKLSKRYSATVATSAGELFDERHQTRLLSNCLAASRSAAFLGMLIGLLVLIGGWGFGSTIWRTVIPGFPVMRPNTALAIFLLGAATLLYDGGGRSGYRILARICIGIAVMIGTLTLAKYASGANFLDHILFRQAVLLAPGRSAATLAVCVLSLSGALLLRRNRQEFKVAQYLALGVALVAVFNTVGELYGIKSFYAVGIDPEYLAMAIHSSLALLALAFGILLSRPEWGIMATITSESLGGVMARRLLPGALCIPIVSGWLRWAGQQHGLFGISFGLGLVTCANISALAIFIWKACHTLNRLDSVRILAEKTSRESDVQFRTLLESAPDAVAVVDHEDKIVLVNARLESLFGYGRSEILGQAAAVLWVSSGVEPMDFAAEQMGRRKDDSHFWGEVSLSPIETAQGTRILVIRDITERKQIEQQLQESERRYRVLLESLPQMLWTLRADGECDYFSPQWFTYTGIPEAVLISTGWPQLIYPDDLAGITKIVMASVAAGTSYEVECRIRNAAGAFRWFHAVAVPTHDAQGKVIKWFGAATDIHKIKMAEAALRTSEANFRLLLDSMAQMAWTSNAQGVTDYYNHRCYEYTGLVQEQPGTRGSAPGPLMLISQIHPDDRQATIEVRARAFASGQPFLFEFRLLRASDQTYRWHSASGVPARNSEGEVVRWIGTLNDIDDYKQAEAFAESQKEILEDRVQRRTAQLHASEDWLQSLVEGVKDHATLMLDPEGRVTTWNIGAERIKGYTSSQIIGHDFSCFYTAEDIARGHPRSNLQTAAEAGTFEEEGWRVRRDGSRFWAEVLITARRDNAGHLLGFSKIIRDITERRRDRQQLLDARQRAEDANRAKSDFLATMSHEIRTPMNAILGMADMLWESKLDADQMQYVEVFRRAGSSLLMLINDILDLSKIESGHIDLENVEFDLEEVIDQAIELTAVRARAKHISVVVRLVPGLPFVLLGDPTRLKQILINLLGNAVKFTEVGGVVLTVRNIDPGEPGKIEFSVSDTGLGIPAEKLQMIFEDFTQADTSTTRNYGGTGLGLAISRRLVAAMNGQLSVSSTAAGSTFRFTVSFGIAPQQKPKTLVELPEMYGRRVLVIDDDPTNCLILRESLSTWGVESNIFEMPREALVSLAEAMAGENPYALAIVDSRMPGMDGFESASAIRAIAPDLPVVMLTCDARIGDAARSVVTGLSGYAVRPVKRSDLLRLICGAMKPAARDHEAPILASMPPPTHGSNILVVEDSSDNRLLIQAYIKGSSHVLTFAENGKVAVDLFTRSSFDLILMDMQMPVMDGLAATRAIRAVEKERKADPIPIVALTANARPEDAQMGSEAGCTGHLSKPISKHTLLEHIDKYAASTTLPPAPHIFIRPPPGLEAIVPGYLAARRNELPGMTALLAASDFPGIACLGHDMKGTGTSYGFPELTRIGAALEQSAKQPDVDALHAQLTNLQDYLSRVKFEL